MDPLHTYDAYFTFLPLMADRLQQLRAALTKSGADVWNSGVEFQYSGKDRDRWVVSGFRAMAAIVGDADGELRCEIEADPDPRYEFYTIREGCLWLQHGQLVRGEKIGPV